MTPDAVCKPNSVFPNVAVGRGSHFSHATYPFRFPSEDGSCAGSASFAEAKNGTYVVLHRAGFIVFRASCDMRNPFRDLLHY